MTATDSCGAGDLEAERFLLLRFADYAYMYGLPSDTDESEKLPSGTALRTAVAETDSQPPDACRTIMIVCHVTDVSPRNCSASDLLISCS
jgi:hypothetical protein